MHRVPICVLLPNVVGVGVPRVTVGCSAGGAPAPPTLVDSFFAATIIRCSISLT